MAVHATTRGVPYPDEDEPNNAPLYLQLLAEWVNDNTIDAEDVPTPVVTWGDVTDKPAAFPPSLHNHDDRYYTDAEIADLLAPINLSLAAKAPKASPTFSGTTTIGAADTDVEKVRAVVLETDARTVELGYTGTDLTTVTEKAGATPVKTTTIAYSSGRVSTITEVVGLTTVTTTLTYDGAGTLTGSTRSVA